MTTTVLELTDVNCSWAWGSEPKIRWLRVALSGQVQWRRVFGVHIAAGEFPSDGAQARRYHAGIRQVSAYTKAPRPLQTHRFTRTSLPADTAAAAAELQGERVADLVTRRLREQIYIQGDPADDLQSLVATLSGITNLDVQRLLTDMQAAAVQQRISDDMALVRNPVHHQLPPACDTPHHKLARTEGKPARYPFPTLLLQQQNRELAVAGWRTLSEYVSAFRDFGLQLPDAGTPLLEVEEAVTRFRTLSTVDLELLCGTNDPGLPAIETGNGPLYVHPEDKPRFAVSDFTA